MNGTERIMRKKIGQTSKYIFRVHLGNTGINPGKHNTLDMVTQKLKTRQTPQCLAEMTQDHSHALANLATATQSNCTTVANMSKTITELTLQLGQANAKPAEAQSSIATLTSKLAQTGTRPNCPPTTPTGPIDKTLMEIEGYFWSHGFKMKKGHNITTCQFQKQRHMTESTRSNKMGGKMYCKVWDK